MMLENSKVRRDGSKLILHDDSSSWFGSFYNYVDKEVQIERCNIYDDLVNQDPIIKFLSMLAAVVVCLLAICGLLICCSYC
jgi:hypothetical protein